MKSIPAISLSLFTLLPALLPAQATEKSPDPKNAIPANMLVEELPNGLQVVIEERHAVPVVRVMAYMRVGSLYEGEYLGSGLSHYMEHIVAGGSTRRTIRKPDGSEGHAGLTEEEGKKIVKSIGGDTNAETYYNFTQYYITTKSEFADTATERIADWLQHCQFDATEVKREQGVVQQELLRNLDNVGRILGQTFSETMFKVHPVRVPVVGYQDCIQKITRDDMFRFYKKNYTPQNCVVSIVGDIDKDQMLETVRKFFGGWKRKSLEPYIIPSEPEQTAMRWVEKEHGSTKTCQVAMGVPTIPLLHPDLYALDMLSNVLGSSASARLPQKFEHDPGRAIKVTGVGTSSWTPVFGAGRLAVYFSTQTAEEARKTVKEMWAEMIRLKTELVSQDEIKRALKVLEKNYYAGRATVEDRAEELASNLAWVNDPVFNDHYLEKIKTVTAEDIQAMARKYLTEDKLNVVIIKPPEKKAAKTVTAAVQREGETKKVVLENGLTLLLKRVPDYGMVDVQAAFNGGVIYETEKTNGLFFLMANTFWRGTKNRPLRAMMQEMDELGMSLGAESHNNVVYVSMNSLASDQKAAFDLFSDVLQNPSIDKVWVDQFKGLLLHRILPNLAVQASSILDKVVRENLYSVHPYRRQRFGTNQSVASFTVDDVRKLYETYIRPNNCVLAVYGDIDVAKTEALVRKSLGSWKPGKIPPSQVVPDPIPTEGKTIDLTNRQIRTNYRIAWRAFPRQATQDRMALSVMNTIIGASGWLNHRLREGENKYVYSVQTIPYMGDGAGHLAIDTDFVPHDEKAVLGIIDGVISDIQNGKFSDEELALAKRMLSAYDALGKIENSSVAQGEALNELYGEGYDWSKRYYEGLRKITREDVIRVAKTIFSRPALRVLIRPQSTGD